VKVPPAFEQQDTSPRFVAEMVTTPSVGKLNRGRILVLRLFHGIRVLRQLPASAWEVLFR
jgi:hypothetical protein